jgi:hypothetical protein
MAFRYMLRPRALSRALLVSAGAMIASAAAPPP